VTKILFLHVLLITNSPSTYIEPFPFAKSLEKYPSKIWPFVKYIVPGPSLLPSTKFP
jgi:hypothetical protein